MVEKKLDPSKVWVIIPAYNEASVIGEVIRRVKKLEYNIVVIDDGSKDDTYLVSKAEGVHSLKHPINLGQGAALQTGIEYFRKTDGKYLVTFDSDGQHDENDISCLIETLEKEQVDIVCGSRFLGTTERMTTSRRFLLKIAIWVNWLLTGVLMSDAHNGLRVLNRQAAKAIKIKHDRMAHATELVHLIKKNNLKFTECPMKVIYTDYSMSKGQKASGAINILLDFIFGRIYK